MAVVGTAFLLGISVDRAHAAVPAACMERVARILEADPARSLAVVLSAARGVTDALLGLVAMA
jgi:hypothetical protein